MAGTYPPGVQSQPLPVGRVRRRAWWVGVPAVVVAAVALAVFFASSTILDSVDGTGAAPAAARSSGPPLVTPEAYQQMLASADAALAVAFQQFAAAPGPAALDSTATALALAIDAETDRLAAVRAPEPAAGAHQLLVGALSRLQWEPAGVDIEGRVDGASCTGPAGAASVARTVPAGQVRAAAEQLKTVDARYVFGSFLPAQTEVQARRMGNGTYLKRASTNGSGLLKVNNNGPRDTAVSLVLVGETAPRLTVYVHANASFTARGITDGNYSVYTTAGVDWDPGMRVFSRDCTFTKFREPLNFKTNSSTYTEWTITLSPSETGNAPIEDVDAGSFPTG
ncbi:hypothetical protein [Virgisporangium ochraceum]|uniref:hypothetical protein n=1 Tax=Virgisporangium ochraceum TaxID=65505 RepID=UPI001945B723|nr:hypothetical protein [Virgisporangium ochraceum]